MADANNAKQPYPCPECGVTFGTVQGVARHRLSRHGVPGSSSAAIQRHKLAAKGKLLAPAPKVPVPTRNQKTTNLQVNKVATAPVIDQAIAGYAIAKLESLAEKIAQENGMPEKEFTRNVARLFAALMTRK